MYEFIITDNTGKRIAELPYESISLTEELNKGLDGSVSTAYPSLRQYATALKTTPDTLLAATPRYWELRKDSVLLFGGVLGLRRVFGGQTGATNYELAFSDYLALLSKRRFNGRFFRTATDSAQIVEDMLATVNAINPTGIAMGLQPTTKNRQLTSDYGNIRDEIVSMSNVKKDDGYDFEVDVTKSLNIYYPKKGTSRPNIIFDDFNIISWSGTRELMLGLSNKVYALGQGYGEDMVVSSAQDTSSQITWGLLEDAVAEKQTGSSAELTDRAQQEINASAFPTEQISLSHRDGTPNIETYNVGDSVRVKIFELNFDKMLRVIKRTFQITSKGDATVTLSFEEV